MYNFRTMVSRLAASGEDRIFLNSSEEHAVVVLSEMFRKAQSSIKIFAGCLYEHVGNAPEYIQTLSDFIDKGGSVRILLNNLDEEGCRQSNLFKRLAYYKSIGMDVEIRSTSARPFIEQEGKKKEVHFTICDDKAYRIETDIEQRAALCNFNGAPLAQGFGHVFDDMFSDGIPVDLKEL